MLKIPRFLYLLTLLVSTLSARETTTSIEARTFTTEQKPTATKGVPADLNGAKTVFTAPAKKKPLKVAVYDDDGSGDGGVHNVSNRLLQIPGTQITLITAEEVGTVDLTAYDLVVFSGGLHRKQSATLGEAGQVAVKNYVRGGGTYLGVCAGAYLAMSGPSRLGMVNAKPIFPKRGVGYVELELSDAGRKQIEDVPGVFKCRYNNGPVVEPAGLSDLPTYSVLAYFRSEPAKKNASSGKMTDSPAIISATFGKGRVLTISPHPENSPGLQNLIPRVVLSLFP